MNNLSTIEELYSHFLECDSLVTDTRKVVANSIFFALKGDNFDANDFANEALDKGAKYVVIDDVTKKKTNKHLLVKDVLTSLQQLASYHRKKLDTPIIAITGSNGKTTTKELISVVLSKKYNVHCTIGNFNNHIGVPLTLLQLKKEHDLAIVEMGANHQGEIESLCEIALPNYGIITNIGKAHLEGFGGLEGVIKGKSELYKYIFKINGTIFYNSEEKILDSLCRDYTKKISYAKSKKAAITGNLSQTHPTIKGEWNSSEKSGNIDSTLYGEYNFSNILAAICIGNFFKVNAKEIDGAINSYVSENNRSELKKFEEFEVFLDAYNANPSSMQASISNFSKNNNPKKIIVLGDMFELGDSSEEEHLKLLSTIKDYDFHKIALVGGNFYLHKENITNFNFFKTTEEAKVWFNNLEKKNSQVLIKGSRGMALERLLAK